MGEFNKVSFEDTSIAFSAKSNFQLKKAKVLFSVVNSPWMAKIATNSVKIAISLGLPIKWAVKPTAFEHFCGGETIEECHDTIETLGSYGIGTILDYSVEGEDDEAVFDATRDEIIKTIEHGHKDGNVPFSVFKVTGLGATELLGKVNDGDPLSAEEKEAYARIEARVLAICKTGHALNVPVLVDAEETWIQKPIDRMAYQMMEKFNLETAIVFNTFQMYRSDMLENLKQAIEVSKGKNYFIGAKLVRGAYMEKERERAEKMGYPSPIQPNKEATDKDFNAGIAACVDNIELVTLVCGSHNEYSNAYLAELMHNKGIEKKDNRLWFAQLYGMSDNISFKLAKEGYNLAKYVPYGPVKSVMPYLFRRAEENTSVAGQSSRELDMIKKEIIRRKSA